MPPHKKKKKKKKNWNIVGIRGVAIAFGRAEGIWNGLPKLLCITSMACPKKKIIIIISSVYKKNNNNFMCKKKN